MGPRFPIAVLAVLLAGCPTEPPPPDEYGIQFQLDNQGEGATCMAGTTCGSFGMGCDAKVAVRILDLPDPDDPSAQPDPRAPPKCLDLLDGDSLCAIGDATFTTLLLFTNLPREPGQIEVTIWPKTAAVEECPRVPYDVTGRPIPHAGPTSPAFGRRIFFDFGGQETIARIPLACTNAAALVDVSCQPPATFDFEVHAEDLDSLLLGISQDKAQFLQVRVGQPTPADEEVPPDNFHIVPAETIELGLNGGASPFWREDEAQIPADFDFSIEAGKDICAIVTDFGSPPAATCTKITAEQAMGDQDVTIDAYMVSTETWQKIQTAIEINFVPSDGLVLGRVVDTNMAPLDGVVISADTPLPPIFKYLNDDLTDYRDDGDPPVPLTETSTSGYFVAQSARFLTAWDATRPGTWRVVGTPTDGTLNNKTLTVVLIQMTQDFGE